MFFSLMGEKIMKEQIQIFFSFRNEGVSLPVTIGNIPHKIAFQTFDDKGEDFQRLPDNWTQKYPSLPAHTGNKYISYKMK